ncbi:MAG: hypothetical protein DHS20C11_11640 [Lysobacteraceae bacterium]|nr:MAG: hypothetical protein DHS20C11_11640 [Xanthomonadaceae bacterium]
MRRANDECGLLCRPRRAWPEAHICVVPSLAKDFGHCLRNAPRSCTLEVKQSRIRIDQSFLNVFMQKFFSPLMNPTEASAWYADEFGLVPALLAVLLGLYYLKKGANEFDDNRPAAGMS